MDETVLSKIIHGYRNPTATQRRLLAHYLKADEEWLFEPLTEASRTDDSESAANPGSDKATADAGG